MDLVRSTLMAVIVFIATVCMAQEKEQRSSDFALLPGYRDWLPSYSFEQKSFTFVRIRHSAPAWSTDYPDADWNLSAQLQRHTLLDVDPKGKVLQLTDPALPEYPFIYMVEPGALVLREDEVTALRQYLLGGGFLMVDDFWGEEEWRRFCNQMNRVFPDRKPQELPLDHGIFRCAFDLQERPQVPSIHAVFSGEAEELSRTLPAGYHAIYDDNGRMMLIACHNTDLADGWERERADPAYYREFSARRAYPMAINIIFFALTQ